MTPLETLQIGGNHVIVEIVRLLVHLIEVAVGFQDGGIDTEGDKHLGLMLGGIVGNVGHLRGIERADDDIKRLGVLRLQDAPHVGMVIGVPCFDVDRDTLLFEAVTGHEHSAVVFHHTPSVSVHIVQWQHHAHSDGSLFQLVARVADSRLFLGRCGGRRGVLVVL